MWMGVGWGWGWGGGIYLGDLFCTDVRRNMCLPTVLSTKYVVFDKSFTKNIVSRKKKSACGNASDSQAGLPGAPNLS